MSWTSARKEKRMTEVAENTISEQKYNLFLGGTVFYGLLVNIILCAVAGETMLDWVVQSKSNSIILCVGYLVFAAVGIIISHKSSSPAISFLGYNLLVVPMGLMVSVMVSAYLSAGMGDVVFQAIIITAVTTFAMIVLSCAFPNFFAKIGGILCAALIGLIVGELLSLLIFRSRSDIFAWLGAAIFSLYIGYDYWKAQQYPKTVDNAIDSAVDIYLDIINLFIRILQILGNSRSRD
ncbi:MAG: Bax inhibitor-1 family protein [Clostridiales bacterium]|nr:Bax inhibitor-1/YccA family protein [Clostridiales bacterium]MCR5275527.1 Bax inhibitor-1 family protein [Clostridiales bacterium]